jgi:hypothetical protein
MIRYNLRCRKAHEFEGWFRNAAAFDEQAGAGEVVCPVCGSKKVEKALMAPSVASGRGRGRAAREAEQAGKMMTALRELRSHVEANCDYVGPSFAEEARRIHYGESEERNIYGETTSEEAKALEDEGVEVKRIPWVPLENS